MSVAKRQLQFVPPTEAVIIALIGEPKSGKSTLIKSLMKYYNDINYFKFGLVITGTKFNGDFDFVEESPALQVWDKYDEERLKKYFSVLEKRANKLHEAGKGKKLPPSFLILDDLLGSIDNSPWLKNTLTRFRHYNVTIMLAAQYAAEAKGCGTLFKSVTNLAFMFPSHNANQVEAMHRAWGGWYKKENDFRQAMIQVQQVDYACLLFQKDKKSIDQAYMQFKCSPAPDKFKMNLHNPRRNKKPEEEAPKIEKKRDDFDLEEEEEREL